MTATSVSSLEESRPLFIKKTPSGRAGGHAIDADTFELLPGWASGVTDEGGKDAPAHTEDESPGLRAASKVPREPIRFLLASPG
ncbi:hypothetical protein AKJ09_02413 [Labilithrix luteola]|uniref:Uncharacterized protein n=1 Tax=Labilithrix luteola TaxID=1391654 RepID=A0A0K1PRL8_9BACT|nr:hypothetical protein [Labilithrix luteola]AKU95749.1 hypothetical protein AKJ09_02413 [Labilithrix luteola]